ncbi:MAG TPA: GGDEF domain-containing protein [Mycobacteriales bacterium]
MGKSLQARAHEVAEAVVRGLWGAAPPRGALGALIVERLLRDSAWSTAQLGRWLATGASPAASERVGIAAHGRDSADGYVSMADMTKSYLIWRDATLRIVEEETSRLELHPEVRDMARSAIRYACDAALVGLVKEYDAAKQDLQRRLDAEHAQLQHLALHDPLTGLANRTLLLDRLEHALGRTERRPETIAVLYLDLDGFKEVNDNHGHHVGDQVLIEVGQRLLALVRSTDTVARLGGDEFVILCEQIAGGQAELDALADRVRAAVAGLQPGGRGGTVSVSVGTVLAAPGFDTEAMLRAADAAMYAAKHASDPPVCAET